MDSLNATSTPSKLEVKIQIFIIVNNVLLLWFFPSVIFILYFIIMYLNKLELARTFAITLKVNVVSEWIKNWFSLAASLIRNKTFPHGFRCKVRAISPPVFPYACSTRWNEVASCIEIKEVVPPWKKGRKSSTPSQRTFLPRSQRGRLSVSALRPLVSSATAEVSSPNSARFRTPRATSVNPIQLLNSHSWISEDVYSHRRPLERFIPRLATHRSVLWITIRIPEKLAETGERREIFQ